MTGAAGGISSEGQGASRRRTSDARRVQAWTRRSARARASAGRSPRHAGRPGALLLYGGYRAVDLVVRAAPLQVGRIVVTGNVRLSERGGAKRWHTDSTVGASSPRTGCLPAPPARVAMGGGCGASPGAALDHRGPRRRAAADRDQPAGQPALPDRSVRHRHRRVRSEDTAEFDLPIVDGLVRSPKRASRRSTGVARELAARVIDSVATRKAIAKRLSQIDVSDLHDVVVLLDGDPALLHLGDERFVERLRSVPRGRLGAAGPRGGHRLRRPAVRRSRVREAARRGRRRSRPADRRRPRDDVLKGDPWHERNATWWAWTSARPRSRPSSAR